MNRKNIYPAGKKGLKECIIFPHLVPLCGTTFSLEWEKGIKKGVFIRAVVYR